MKKNKVQILENGRQVLMSAEQELIAACSHPYLSPKQIERITQLIANGIDWHLLISTAQFHRVFPLLYANISRNIQGCVPADVAFDLKKQYLDNSAFNLFLSHQLVHLLDIFDKNNIVAVPFKGPLLAEHVFGDINCRTCCDLDILIAQTDLAQAVLLLQSERFHFDIDLDFDQFVQLARDGSHAAMIKEKPSCMVELHWEMTGRCFARTVELQDFKARLRKIQFMGRQVLSLSPEDLLVYLCIHGNRHYWRQLDFISCVAGLIIREKELDWKLALEIAAQFGARRMLLVGCLLAHEVLDTCLDSTIAEKLENEPGVRDVAGRVEKGLFAGVEEMERNLPYWNEVKYHWNTMDNVSDWFHCSMKPLFQPTHSDRNWLQLPASISRLYYVLRPVRLGVKYVKKFTRRMTA